MDVFHRKSHHFRNVVHKPTGTLLSPDFDGMIKTGMMNFYRVLVEGGHLGEMRAEEAIITPNKDGVTLLWEPSIRRPVKLAARFVFREPNIIDMELSAEAHGHLPGFEVLFSTYMGPGFESRAYVARKEFGSNEPEQIRIVDQPMIHGLYPFFPRDEAGAHRLTDGRHQKGRHYWRMAIGRRYGLPMALSTDGKVDVLIMGQPDDVYAVGATYTGDADTDSVAKHRSLYLSLFGEDFQPGTGRKTHVRMVIGEFGSDSKAHAEVHQAFLEDVGSVERSFWIHPDK
ncbi:MAG: hypothetical protein P8L49_04235 [Opitutaceae bacterium]|jgi:hypothetical protein|nr:hypothetical protein [Opitutaceae bacterium]